MRQILQYAFGMIALLLACVLMFIPLINVEETEDGTITYGIPIIQIGVLVIVGIGFIYRALTNKDKQEKAMVDAFSDGEPKA